MLRRRKKRADFFHEAVALKCVGLIGGSTPESIGSRGQVLTGPLGVFLNASAVLRSSEFARHIV